jgi:hypothetical protein
MMSRFISYDVATRGRILDMANLRIGHRLRDELHCGHAAPNILAKAVGVGHLDLAARASVTAIVVPALDRLGAYLGRLAARVKASTITRSAFIAPSRDFIGSAASSPAAKPGRTPAVTATGSHFTKESIVSSRLNIFPGPRPFPPWNNIRALLRGAENQPLWGLIVITILRDYRKIKRS